MQVPTSFPDLARSCEVITIREICELKLKSFPAERAASKDKTLHMVQGANHMSLYDVPRYVDEAVSKLAAFFKGNL
jgi:hypothetical protein